MNTILKALAAAATGATVAAAAQASADPKGISVRKTGTAAGVGALAVTIAYLMRSPRAVAAVEAALGAAGPQGSV